MTSIELALPDAAYRFIEAQVASGRYSSPSDVLLDLIEKARMQAAQEKLAELILEGESSGDGVEFNQENWQRRRAELLAEAERRRSA